MAAVSAIRLSGEDNVATLLVSAVPGDEIRMLHEETSLLCLETIEAYHKVALSPCRRGDPLIKGGVTIGRATEAIEPGFWVHLSNCASAYESAAREFDGEDGSDKGLRYE